MKKPTLMLVPILSIVLRGQTLGSISLAAAAEAQPESRAMPASAEPTCVNQAQVLSDKGLQ